MSHGPLLLRSGKSDGNLTRVDILFYDVCWVTLPVWLDGIRIERGELSEIPLPLTETIKTEARLRSVFRVISQGVIHYVVAAAGVCVAEDQGHYGENSLLLPNLDFRAFMAPLRKKE